MKKLHGMLRTLALLCCDFIDSILTPCINIFKLDENNLEYLDRAELRIRLRNVEMK